MFSKACEYAIRATVYVASQTNDATKVGIEEICAHIEAPKHFTAKILQVLGRANIISSQKGVHGGFYLNQAQRAKSVKEIIFAIDGDHLLTGCGLGLKQCSEEKPCPIHQQFKTIRNALNNMMHDTTIEMLAQRLKSGGTVLMH